MSSNNFPGDGDDDDDDANLVAQWFSLDRSVVTTWYRL